MHYFILVYSVFKHAGHSSTEQGLPSVEFRNLVSYGKNGGKYSDRAPDHVYSYSLQAVISTIVHWVGVQSQQECGGRKDQSKSCIKCRSDRRHMIPVRV